MSASKVLKGLKVGEIIQIESPLHNLDPNERMDLQLIASKKNGTLTFRALWYGVEVFQLGAKTTEEGTTWVKL